MTTRSHTYRCGAADGFTIVELMVVVALLAILLGILFPTIGKMVGAGKIDTGVNTVAAAAKVIRVYAARERGSVDLPLNPSGIVTSYNQGTALVFTHAGEIRLTECYQRGRYGNGENQWMANTSPYPMAAFTDIFQRDYVRLPSDTAVAGIIRNGPNASDLLLIAAPFAVRFDRHGNLLAGYPATPAAGNLDKVRFQAYYDGDYDGFYELENIRPNNYNPLATSTTPDANTNKIPLPFEQLESVVGVVVYSTIDFTNAGLTWGSSSTTDINNWLLNPNNGRVIFFSRYTGSVVRDK